MTISEQDNPSTRPYLIRALHEWCCDNGFSPFLAVHVDGSVQVPMEFVKNGEIVLNVSVDATSSLRLGNDFIEFKARFGGVVREIIVPVDHVVAIYARENGQGMAFPAPPSIGLTPATSMSDRDEPDASMSTPPELTTTGAEARGVLRAVPTELNVGQSPEKRAGDSGDDDSPPEVPPPGGGRRPVLKIVK